MKAQKWSHVWENAVDLLGILVITLVKVVLILTILVPIVLVAGLTMGAAVLWEEYYGVQKYIRSNSRRHKGIH